VRVPPDPEGSAEDPHVARLAGLFREHPAWTSAARHVADGAATSVRFRHLPGRAFRLVREAGESRLVPGRAEDPDFEFVFTPEAVDRLADTEGGIADFAITLFDLIEHPDPEVRVGFRVVAPFKRLARRGYVRVLAAAGPRVWAYGAARSVRGLGALRRLVERHRREG